MRIWIAVVVVVALFVVAAAVLIVQKRHAELARQESEQAEQAERAERDAEEAATRAAKVAERERWTRHEQARVARQEEALRESLERAEQLRLAEEARRAQEDRRRKAAELARRDREQQLAEQERLAEVQRIAAEQEEERRRAEELAARREAEETATRETELAVEEEAQVQAAATAVLEEPDDDTPNVETETTIDEAPDRRGWRVTGDLRPIIDGLQEEAREGSTDTDIAPGIRARIGATFGITQRLRLGVRIAGAGFLDDFSPDFISPGEIQDSSELGGGEVTFDQLYFHWKRIDRFDIAVGRLQTRFVLRGGVYAKSLDRNDSHNWRVTWTDGLQATLRTGDWTSNFIWQRNTRGGSGSIRRDPLDFDDDGARNTYFLAFENLERRGSIVQRAFDVSYLPSTLLKDGEPDGRRTDYWGLVGRLAVRWPPEAEGLRLRAGVEIGYAPETPTLEAKGLPGSGDADGLAWNLVASAMDFAPGHSIGVNYGRTGAGWLLSPQYRPNEELIEVRYMWRPERFPQFESRIRRRQELDQLVDAVQKRTQYDFFIRLTWRFTIKDY